jgi:predicted Rdx family selenoprotein
MLHQLWPTNLWLEQNILSQEDIDELYKVAVAEVPKYNGVYEIHAPDMEVPNLFKEEHYPVVKKFKEIIKTKLYTYLSFEGFIDPAKLVIEINAFPRSFEKGFKAKPHTHREVEYVGVFYVQVDPFEANKSYSADKEQGRLVLIDPIAQRAKGLNHNMLVQITPQPNMLLFHPAYLFHEAETNFSDKNTVAIAMNIRVKDRLQRNSFIAL